MQYPEILNRIKKSLNNIYPPGEHVSQLSLLLNLNQRAIRRKLSGDLQFTIEEITQIAKFHSLTLGDILYTSENQYQHPMQLVTWDYSQPDKYKLWMKKLTRIFTLATQSGKSVFLHTNNFIPYFSLYYHKKLFKFLSLKWLYYSNPPVKIKNPGIIFEHGRFNTYREGFLNVMQQLNTSKYILHENFFRNTLYELIAFYNKKYINRDEYFELLDEFSSLLKKFKILSDRGYFMDKTKKVEIYITNLWLPNSFSILNSELINFANINAHYWDNIASLNQETYKHFEQWFNSWLQVSECISFCSESRRLNYINQQRKAINDAYDYIPQ